MLNDGPLTCTLTAARLLHITVNFVAVLTIYVVTTINVTAHLSLHVYQIVFPSNYNLINGFKVKLTIY